MLKNLSIVIPARNEEDNLAKLIPALFKRHDKNILELIVVDDNSTDSTHYVLKKLRKRYDKLRIIRLIGPGGVGLALREGIKKLSTKSQYVLFFDSDFIFNIQDIAKMIEQIKTYDGVVGSRFVNKNSLHNYPKLKLIANRSYFYLARLLLGIRQKDLSNNFKLYRKEIVDRLFPLLKSSNFALNVELGCYPVLLGYRIGELPVAWKERTKHMGVSKFNVLNVWPSYLHIFFRLLYMRYFNSGNKETKRK